MADHESSPGQASRPRRLAAVFGEPTTWVAFGLPLGLYLLTLAPTVYHLDSAELTTAAATGGLVRATGYPLYLLLGRVWSAIPVGDVGYRMNLLSAVCGALTLALAERVLRRLGVGPWAALGALGLLMSARFFWSLSLVAEVYTLHTAFLCGILLALLGWSERPTPRRLAWATFLVGLSCGNHMATVLLVPGCLWHVLRTAPRRALGARSLLWAGAGLAAGLAVYLYLPALYLSRPAFNYAGHYDAAGRFVSVDLATWQGLWWLASGRSFADQMLAYDAGALLAEAAHFGAELWRAFLGVGIGPGLLGLGVLASRDRRLGGTLLLMFVGSAGFYVGYGVRDKDTMFLPAYVIWALWLGLGYQWLLDWVARGDRPGLSITASGALRAWMAASVVFAVAWSGPLVDLSDDWSARTRGEAILRRLEPGALVVGWWGTVPAIEYLQLVEGQRPDVTALNRFLISSDDLRQLVLAEMDRRAVYFDHVPDLLPELGVEPVGPLYRLSAPNGGRKTDDLR